MLKKILFLCLLFTAIVLAQQYTNEKYEKYIGTKLGKYPLTVAGLKKAILSLDSGVVYISYPGLWDTVGLGPIPSSISIDGYLFGNYIKTIVKANTTNNKYFWSNSNYPLSASFLNGTMSFGFLGRQRSWYGNFFVQTMVDRYAPSNTKADSYYQNASFRLDVDTSYEGEFASLFNTNYQTVIGSDSLCYNVNNATLYNAQYSIAYSMPYQAYQWAAVRNLDSYIDWQNGTDTVLSSQGIKNISSNTGTIGTGVYFNCDYYMYYTFVSSTLASRMLTGKKVFLFYGNGAYSSWFGGSVNSGAGYNFASDAQASDAYIISLDGTHSLTIGLEVTFKANTANTDGATLQVNSLTAKAITKASSGAVNTALATGDILAGQIVKCVYDGTQFQIISRLAQ